MTENKTRILYVEDEADLGNVTKQYLELVGFQVAWYYTGYAAQEAYRKDTFDVVIIDVHLPDMDGFELARRIKEIHAHAHFLFLTARNLKEDKIQGLKLGAFDYITKPFDVDELVLRIRNFVTRQHERSVVPEESPVEEVVLRDVRLNQNLLSLSIGDQFHTTLTMREAELFAYFCQHRNHIVRREDILLHIWGDNDYFLGRSLDVFISRLRKILAHSKSVRIENVYGVGFKLSSPE